MAAPLEQKELEKLLRQLPRSRAPDELWDEVHAEVRRGVRVTLLSVLRRPVESRWVAAAAVAIAVLAGVYAGTLRAYSSPQRWEVVPIAGAPLVGDGVLEGPGGLRKGEWLVTDARSTAHLSVGRIGTAEVGPSSRLRLEQAPSREHRLTLDRGSIRAVITAPPRLFFVETPAALATDLGCAYTLSVDSLGTTRIHVTAGWVELREGGQVTLVPAGFVAIVEVGGRPGTPFVATLSASGQDILRRIDAGMGDSTAVVQLLGALQPHTALPELKKQSAITLWHLLPRLDGSVRELLLDGMTALSPPPPGVTREGILSLERPMLERWRRDLRPMWSEEAQPLLVRIARRLWEWTT